MVETIVRLTNALVKAVNSGRYCSADGSSDSAISQIK